MSAQDTRRRIPRTDHLLALPAALRAEQSLGGQRVREVVRGVQERARRGEIPPEAVVEEVTAALAASRPASMRPVLNATGVIVHTNLGRAPLSPAARRAVADAAGYADVEFDLAAGVRSRRGAGARAALLRSCPAVLPSGEELDALVVNNGAAALLLAATALAGDGEVILSRGEMIEIGAGFRLPDLIASAGARIREVGATNRTHLADYRAAITERTGALLSIHPSNYRITGFTASVPHAELAELAHAHALPLIADLGSGLLAPEPSLPQEPDARTALEAGADLVITSGDKLLGGPQAGILLGRAGVIDALARHPLARAVRADKLALAALEATLVGPVPPVLSSLRAEASQLRRRTEQLAARIDGSGVPARVVPHDGRVGGGGGAEVPLPGWAVAVPGSLAAPLRRGAPAVVGTLREGSCLLDLRCVPPAQEDVLLAAVLAAADGTSA
ncbi:L-seryl-tRNA(Sec) selenium transferase [Brachybacterium hainanense]|uniref:L-seryl-tRNA(Sec) selenium transferase n=1 Tax=Brachybacterium hainanense TaxID=1541174 RepID=A0ABV6REY0_9MICO